MPADAAVARPWRLAMLAAPASAITADVAIVANVHARPATGFGTKRTARHLGSSPT
jgi:hypothetical protein